MNRVEPVVSHRNDERMIAQFSTGFFVFIKKGSGNRIENFLYSRKCIYGMKLIGKIFMPVLCTWKSRGDKLPLWPRYASQRRLFTI